MACDEQLSLALPELVPGPLASVELLSDAARKSFVLLEPWCQADSSSRHPLANKIIVGMKSHAALYFQAIDRSLETSEQGVTLATNAVYLCDFLCMDVPKVALVAFVNDMLTLACKAHQNAESAMHNFRVIRTGLFEISTMIPGAVNSVTSEAEVTKNAIRKDEVLANGAAAFSNMARGKDVPSNIAAGVMAVAAIPHITIVLPIVIPIFALMANKVEDRLRRKTEARKKQEVSCKEALTTLNEAQNDIAQLLESISEFATWWLNISTRLGNLKERIESAGSSKPGNDVVGRIKERWLAVRDNYRSYVSEISKLQDFYPDLAYKEQLEVVLPNINAFRLDGHQKINSTLAILSKRADLCQTAYSQLHAISSDVHPKPNAAIHRQLAEIRTHLKLEFEVLMVVVERHAALDDNDDSIADQSLHAQKTVETVRVALSHHGNTSEILSSHEKPIESFLLSVKSKRARIAKHARRAAKGVEAGEGSKRVDRLFLEKNIACAHPDGSNVIALLRNSISELELSLKDLLHFWETTLALSSADLTLARVSRHENLGISWRVESKTLREAWSAVSTALQSFSIDVTETLTHDHRSQLHKWLFK